MPTFKPRSQPRKWWPYVVILVVGLVWYFDLHHISVTPKQSRVYPPAHPLTASKNAYVNNRYIFPNIEDAGLLKELGSENLVVMSKWRDADFPDIERSTLLSLNVKDDPDDKVQRQQEDEENASSELLRAKNNFKNHDKVVYKPAAGKEYPEVVVVTAIDFTRYSMESLIKVVQNRVDYAHVHNYGLYVEWYQAFLPKLNALFMVSDQEKRKWVRIYCMRAAMHAFPGSKWFWYLDEQALIMDNSVDLQKQLLDPEVLEPKMMREQPVMLPSGVIKTYKNTKASAVNLIVTQSKDKIETHSFAVKNTPVGKSMIETWGDPLYLNYQNFPNGPDSALTHILQWHPFLLSKSTIVPSRTFSSKHVVGNADEKIHYHEGDFIVHWGDVAEVSNSEQILNYYAQKSLDDGKQQ